MQIDIQNVSKVFGSARALDNLNFHSPGDHHILTLIGPSGGGKSTLLRLLGGLSAPDSGTLSLNGNAIPRDDHGLLEFRRRLGFVFQHFNLFPHLSILRNITLPMEKVHGSDPTTARERAMQVLDQFGLAAHATKFPSQISGGQAQRVALARAIAPRPQLLLLDEPTSALDPEITADVLEMILALAKNGQEIVLSTHEMGFAKALGGTVCYLQNGSIMASGDSSAMFSHPPHPDLTRFLSRVTLFSSSHD